MYMYVRACLTSDTSIVHNVFRVFFREKERKGGREKGREGGREGRRERRKGMLRTQILMLSNTKGHFVVVILPQAIFVHESLSNS